MDEAAQRKGFCNVVYNCKDIDILKKVPQNEMFNMMQKAGNMIKSLPCRYTNYHICHDDPGAEFFISFLRKNIGKFTRLRLRTHLGTFLTPPNVRRQNKTQNAITHPLIY